jgi:orotate phosphoribosyltransferase
MEAYKREFIEFMVDSKVLKFGDFTLKSGRKSPFFMNAGGYVTGSQLKKLGEYYAKAIHDKYGDDFDVLFGPAYKGIPISVVTAIAFSELYGKEVRVEFHRFLRAEKKFSSLEELKLQIGKDRETARLFWKEEQ